MRRMDVILPYPGQRHDGRVRPEGGLGDASSHGGRWQGSCRLHHGHPLQQQGGQELDLDE